LIAPVDASLTQMTDKEKKKINEKTRKQQETAARAKADALRDDDNVFDVAFEQQGAGGDAADSVVSATDIKVSSSATNYKVVLACTGVRRKAAGLRWRGGGKVARWFVRSCKAACRLGGPSTGQPESNGPPDSTQVLAGMPPIPPCLASAIRLENRACWPLQQELASSSFWRKFWQHTVQCSLPVGGGPACALGTLLPQCGHAVWQALPKSRSWVSMLDS